MKEIPLTKGKVALVDDADYEAVMQSHPWYAYENGGTWYAARKVKKQDGTWTTQSLHKFLMPGVGMIDHEDGNGLNDQRYNMRPCSRSQNAANSRKKSGTSKFKGVGWDFARKKWWAKITFYYKNYALGRFSSEEDAARAYDEAATKYHGKFARLNFPI